MWTFGIVTDGKNSKQLNALIQSIIQQQIEEEFEIIIVGGFPANLNDIPVYNNVKWLYFDETMRPGWITKKKNMIAKAAKYDNVCITHDYYLLDEGWYKGWKDKYNFFIATNRINTLEGTRHSDWTIDPWVMGTFLNQNPQFVQQLRTEFPTHNPQYVVGLPYDMTGMEKLQYLSGGYFCAKKCALEAIPQDENLLWGQSEDVIWSQKARQRYTFQFNKDSIVSVQKPNKWQVPQMPDNIIEALRTWAQLIRN